MKKMSLPGILIIASVVSLMFATGVQSQTAQTNRLELLRSSYGFASTKIIVDEHKQKEDALVQYGKSLDSAMAVLTQRGDIDTYGIIDSEAKRFGTDKTVLTNATQPYVVSAITKYQKQIAETEEDSTQRQVTLLKKYIEALNGLVKDLMVQNKIDEAREAGYLRKEAESRLSEMIPPKLRALPTEPARVIDLSGTWIDGWNESVTWETKQADGELRINFRGERWDGTIQTNRTIRLGCHNNGQNWDFIAQLSPDGKRVAGIVTYENGISKKWWWTKVDGSAATVETGRLPVPDKAAEFRGHHYLVVGKPVTWEAARVDSEAYGGHLVILNDTKEKDFVISISRQAAKARGFKGGMVWVGARYEKARWVWLDGSDVSFTLWAPSKKLGKASSQTVAFLNFDDGLHPNEPTGVVWYVIEWDY